MAIKVLKSGLSTTVQDLGRPGYYHIGIPLSGGMDRFALRAANMLVGNPEGAAVRSTASFELSIPYADTVDKPAEIARLKKEIDRLTKDVESKQHRLADESFTSKAPAKVVDALRATLTERQLELKKLRARLQQLES